MFIGLFLGLFICPTQRCGCFVAALRMFWLAYIRTIADVFPGLYIRTIADVFRLAVPELNDIDVSASPAATALALQADKTHQAADRSRHILNPNPCDFGDHIHARPSPTRSVSMQRDAGEYPPIRGGHFPAPDGPLRDTGKPLAVHAALASARRAFRTRRSSTSSCRGESGYLRRQ